MSLPPLLQSQLKAQGGRCFLCLGPCVEPTTDHVLPLSTKGTARHVLTSACNQVAACVVCNHRKGNRAPTEVELRRLMILRRAETGEAEPDDWLAIT